MVSDSIWDFSPILSNADREFIFLGHQIRCSKVCDLCQASILNTFVHLSDYHKTGLQLTPAHLLDVNQYPESAHFHKVRAIWDDMLNWALDNPREFDRLLHREWLDLFARGSPTTVATKDVNNELTHTEEWLTKLWFANAGQYTVPDLARGRPYSDVFHLTTCFEGMHLRRLLATHRPFHEGKCKCAETRGDWGAASLTQAASEGHHAVLMRYTDSAIKEVYFRFLEEEAKQGGIKMPLARVWEEEELQKGFKVLVEEVGVMREQLEGGRLKVNMEMAEVALALVELANAKKG